MIPSPIAVGGSAAYAHAASRAYARARMAAGRKMILASLPLKGWDGAGTGEYKITSPGLNQGFTVVTNTYAPPNPHPDWTYRTRKTTVTVNDSTFGVNQSWERTETYAKCYSLSGATLIVPLSSSGDDPSLQPQPYGYYVWADVEDTLYNGDQWQKAAHYNSGSTGADTLQIGSNLYASSDFTLTTVVAFLDETHVSDLTAAASALLDLSSLLDASAAFLFYDKAPAVRVTWGGMDGATPAAGWLVFKSVAGGSFSQLGIAGGPNGGEWIDPDVQLNTSYSYKVQLFDPPNASVTTAPVTIAINPSLNGVTQMPAVPILSNAAAGSAPSIVAEAFPAQLKYRSFSQAEADPEFVTIYGLDSGYLVSAAGSLVRPTMLACLGDALFDQLSGPMGPAEGRVWAKSRGFLLGNSPRHNPPATGRSQRISFTSFPGLTGSDLRASYPTLTFPNGRRGQWPYQLSRELPFLGWPRVESFHPAQLPGPGWLIYS